MYELVAVEMIYHQQIIIKLLKVENSDGKDVFGSFYIVSVMMVAFAAQNSISLLSSSKILGYTQI